jgi:transcription antitermination factor NusG
MLPLFPWYVFVHIALQNRVRVLGLPGIVSLVYFNGKPAVVPESQIDSLSKAIRLGRAEPHFYLHAGKRVRVAVGPLAGLEGIVIQIRNTTQVVVSFEWMARSVAIFSGSCRRGIPTLEFAVQGIKYGLDSNK